MLSRRSPMRSSRTESKLKELKEELSTKYKASLPGRRPNLHPVDPMRGTAPATVTLQRLRLTPAAAPQAECKICVADFGHADDSTYRHVARRTAACVHPAPPLPTSVL